MNAFDADPDRTVSLAALLLVFDAIFLGISVLQNLFNLFANFYVLLFAVVTAACVAGAVGLLQSRRWAWQVAVGAVIAHLLIMFEFRSILGVLFDVAALYLLFRPGVRARFPSR